MLTIKCPGCHTLNEAPDGAIDEPSKCPSCGCRFIIHDAVVGAAVVRPAAAKKTFPLIKTTIAVLVVCLVGVQFFQFFSSGSSTTSPPPPATSSPQSTPAASSYRSPPASPPTYELPATRKGRVNYSLVETCKSAWRKEGWRNRPRAEQAKAIWLMQAMVEHDCPHPADREATLDYISREIDSW